MRCAICGETDATCLEFHHVDTAQKERCIYQLVDNGCSIARIEQEMEKCIVLCANCHRKVHGGTIEGYIVGGEKRE